MKIAIWWNIPCKSVVPVARELANINNNEVTFISQSDLSESRKQLGWELPDFGSANYVVLPDKDWQSDVKKHILDNYDLHIFNGVYLFPKIRYALDFARRKHRNFGVISEAYHNPYTGIKHLLKTIFTRTITPFRVFTRVKNAKFVLSASGNNFEPFSHLGWRKEQFFPFGYFPENGELPEKDHNDDKAPQILCTGYITKNKGQHLLVMALANLRKKGLSFRCTITGFGPEEENVKSLAKKLHVDDRITFTGVVSDEEMKKIKSSTDVLVAPGIEEPWGIRINEALLARTPVVVSNKIGASYLITKSGAGIVFQSNSIASLEKALDKIFQPEELETYKEKAKKYAPEIMPKSAAQYLNKVIIYSLSQDNKNRPIPTWLKE